MADDRTLAKTDMDSSVAWGCRKDSGMEGVLGGHGDATSRPPRGMQSAGGRRYRIDDPDATLFSTTLVDSERRHIALQPDRAISLAWCPHPWCCLDEVSLNPEDSRHDFPSVRPRQPHATDD